MDKDDSYSKASYNKVTDLDIQALVDGELDERESLLLLDQIEKDPALMGRYAIYRKQKTLLGLWWQRKEH